MAKQKAIRSVAVVAKENHQQSSLVAKKLIDLLASEGLVVLTLHPLKHKNAETVREAADLKRKRPDLLISVGGDGTILRTLRLIDSTIPILGVNVGGRGILAEVLPEQLKSALANVHEGKYSLQEKMRISCSIPGRTLPPALNEVYITRLEPIRTPAFSIRTGGGELLNQRMDGVIVSTPTGSTGHSMSFGSPVLSEFMEAFVITFVASLSNLPPLVVRTTPIRVECNAPTNVIIDGQEMFKATEKAKITISPHKSPAVFMRLNTRGLRQLYNLGFR